jgi:DNA-binding transcriptional MerR regulator
MVNGHRIGEVAARAGVTVDTLRYYEKLGLTLKDVRQLIGDQGRGGRDRCRKVRDLLSVRLKDINTKMAELRSFRRTLRSHLAACERALEDENPACPVISELAR